MRRLIVSLTVALLTLGTVAGVASATHSNGQGPDKDFTNGSTKGPVVTPFGTFPSQAHINAQNQGPLAGETTGSFFLRIFAPTGDVDVTGDVQCLTAVGNSSVNIGIITTMTGSFGPFPEGSLVNYRILARNDDNGEGSQDPPDASGGNLLPPGPTPVTCPFFPISTTPQPQGNVTVHDGI